MSALMTVSRAVIAVALMASAAALGLSVLPAGAGPGGRAVHLGEVMLPRCQARPVAYCGVVDVPLDYASAASPRIPVAFTLVPATGRATGTVLAIEGGPGFSSTGSQSLYLAMMGPLTASRNLLTVDLRGTGASAPVNCPGLEGFSDLQGQFGPAYDKLVAQCGDQLNHTWRYHGGGWVHGSDLFNTAYAARDVEGILTALGLHRVDLYGDSYGSWFAQVFASRYPGLLRSVTLDSTYQVLGLDPWYVTSVITARSAFNAACDRWPACAAESASARSGWALISALARRLDQSPVTGQTTMPDGTTGTFTVSPLTLVNLVNNAGFDPGVYRDLAGAARALLWHGDPAPLLRMAALSIGYDDANPPLPGYSTGLYFAVTCTDVVQLFSRTANPAVRAAQYAAALSREPAETFAPFTVAQWTSLDQSIEAYSACLDWPAQVHVIPPITKAPPLVPRTVPVLILSGDLDSFAPLLRGATLVASQMGTSARVIVFANLTHVTLQDANDACPASVYQRFVVHPGGLARQDASCAAHIAPVHAVGGYPVTLAAAQPAQPAAGNTADDTALRAATVALAAAADELSRYPHLSGSTDRGLRGGTVSFAAGQDIVMTFSATRWTTDATIDGRLAWNQGTNRAAGTFTVRPPSGPAITFTATWNALAQPGQRATITGTEGSRQLRATALAP